MPTKKVLIIGGGPAGLMAAAMLDKQFEVHLFEKEKTVGRKFLVAGKGGFNLTNQRRGQDLVDTFTPSQFLQKSLLSFDSLAFRKWLEELGIPTFVGTSGRVFPNPEIKPVMVLQELKKRLLDRAVKIHTHHEFLGFESPQKIKIQNESSIKIIEGDCILFALGGASWSKTGSKGDWLAHFEKLGIKTQAFQSSNCGINIKWPETLVKSYAGKPLKNIALSVEDQTIKGEALITDNGLEGNAIYPLIPIIRKCLNQNSSAMIHLDFKPLNTAEQLLQKLKNEPSSTKNYARVLNLNKKQIAILKAFTSKEDFLAPQKFIAKIKKLPLLIESLRPIDEAISTVGGIDLNQMNPNFSFQKYPHLFALGEMLDWDAPTGGFLLQACFSMGVFVAEGINNNTVFKF